MSGSLIPAAVLNRVRRKKKEISVSSSYENVLTSLTSYFLYVKTKKQKKRRKMKTKNCMSSSLLIGLLREVDLLDFQVFVGGSITILGSDIVLISGSKGSK